MPFKKTPPLYYSWKNMFRNCRVNRYYEGVSVCKEWLEYETYEGWALSNGWTKGMRVVRIDKSKDFCPENCSVVSVAEANNMRSCVRKVEDGRTMTELADDFKCNDYEKRKRAYRRIFEWGWNVDESFSVPSLKCRREILT